MQNVVYVTLVDSMADFTLIRQNKHIIYSCQIFFD